MIDDDRVAARRDDARLNEYRSIDRTTSASLNHLLAIQVSNFQGGFSRLAFIVCTIVGILLNSIAQADDGLDEYNLALSLFSQSRWKLAAEQFREFLSNYEDHDKVGSGRFYLGLTLGKLNDFKASRNELLKFTRDYRKHPKFAEAKYRIGECSYLLDDLTSAREELEAFLKDFPKDVMCEYALTYLGDTVLRQKDPTAAVKYFDRAIEQFPNGKKIDDAKFGRAKSLEQLKKYDEAIEQYRELASNKDGERSAESQLNIGDSLFERKQLAQAIAAYDQFAKNYPESPLLPTVQLHWGYAYFQSAKYHDAAKQFALLTKDVTQGTTAILWLGRSLKSQGDYAKAMEVLKSASLESAKPALAESILYEQALCERYSQHLAAAQELFLKVLNQFPQGDLADDSLHALVEMSIESGDLDQATKLIARFRTDYPQSGLRLHFEMLDGRLDLARASVKRREERPVDEAKPLYDAAAKKFDTVMTQSSNPRTKKLARYYLALTRQFQNELEKALELLAPLVEQAVTEGAKSDFVDAIVLNADCCFQLQKYDQAAKSAEQYLGLISAGRKVASALSIQALSADKLNDSKTVQAAAKRLVDDYGNHSLTALTVQQLAEAAEVRDDWKASGRWYETLMGIQREPEKQAYAVRGLALSQYSQGDYEAAAETYGRVVSEFPRHKLIAECAYFQAESLMKAKKTDQAIELFRKLFETTADLPLPAGAESQPPFEFYYKAGQWVAILLSNEQKVDEADAAYDALLTRFPKPADLEKRLYQWASLNHDHQKYDRADVLWKRLAEEFPQGAFASEAKLHLAESDFDAGRFEAARKVFEDVVDDPKSSPEIKEWSLYKLVAMAVDKQQWNEVRRVGERLTNEFPQSPKRFYVLYSQAEAYLSKEKPSEQELVAVRELLTRLKAESANDDVNKTEWFDRVWVLLAELNFNEKKYEEVESTVEELKRRSPRSPFLYQAEEVLGRSYKQQAPPKFAEARAAFERVLANEFARRTETAAKAQFLIGETYKFQENWSAAFVAYQKVYTLYKFPEWQANALLMSAVCDEKQNEWKPAVDTYKRILQEFPKFSRIEDVKILLQAAQKRTGG